MAQVSTGASFHFKWVYQGVKRHSPVERTRYQPACLYRHVMPS